MNKDKRAANRLLLLFGLVSLGLLGLPLAAPMNSFKACVSYLLDPVPFYGARGMDRLAATSSGMARLISTDVENQRLREDLRRLPLLEAELDSSRRENGRLRAEVGIKPSPGRALRWAKVLSRDPLNWYRHLLVDAGQPDGVEVNAPVLGLLEGRLGAVGRVVEAGPLLSKVLLLSDETSSAAAYLPARQWEGLVEGQGTARLRMNYLPPDVQIIVGDPVFTSPTSVTFPPDILVGHIVQVFPQDPFLTFQSAEVASAVRPSALKEVLILLPLKSGAAAP